MVYRRYYPLSLSLAGAGVDARRHSAEHYTVYTDTEQVQTAESRLSPAPPQFDHPHHPPPVSRVDI